MSQKKVPGEIEHVGKDLTDDRDRERGEGHEYCERAPQGGDAVGSGSRSRALRVPN
jgi:hypothetical protein